MRATHRSSTTRSHRPAVSAGQSWPRRRTFGAFTVAMLLGVTMLLTPIAAAQSASAPAAQPAEPPGVQFPMAASVDQITESPNAYYGTPVTIVGEVEDVLGPRAFTIEDQDILFDETLLVVSGMPFAEQPEGTLQADMLQSQTLMLSGTVHQFNEAAFEQRLGIELDDNQVAGWAGRPALIADRMMAWSFAFAAPWRNDSTNTANGRSPATIELIARSPTSYDGQAVTVGGYVERVLGERAFVVEDGDLLAPERMLVVTRQHVEGLPGPAGDRGVSTEGFVWIGGTVHQFNEAAFEQQFGLNLDDTQLTEWAGSQAIVAESIIPVRWGHSPSSTARGETEPAPAAQSPVSPQAEPSPQTDGAELQGNTGIDAILNAPDTYVGQTTTVSGLIEQMIGPRSFVLTDRDAEDERMLVIGALTLPTAFVRNDPTPDAGEAVEVTGEIWRFDLGAIEERIGIDLDDSLFEEWTNQPVIVATAIMQPTE